MDVHVDEARGHQQPLGVDDFRTLGRGEFLADFLYFPVRHQDVQLLFQVLGRVDDVAVFYQKIHMSPQN